MFFIETVISKSGMTSQNKNIMYGSVEYHTVAGSNKLNVYSETRIDLKSTVLSCVVKN